MYDCIMQWGILHSFFGEILQKGNYNCTFKAQNGSTLLIVQYYYLLCTSSALDNIQIILCNFNGWQHRAIAMVMHCAQCVEIISEFLFVSRVRLMECLLPDGHVCICTILIFMHLLFHWYFFNFHIFLKVSQFRKQFMVC